MKRLISLFAAGAAVCAITLHAENPPAGQVDFGSFNPPASGGQFVEVNVTRSLISLAAKFVQKEDADIARLLSGLHGIKVNVIEMDDQNRAELEQRVQSVRKQLGTNGWERIVTAQEKDQDVGVYLKTENSDTVQGLVVTVIEGKKQAVFVNIVGNIKPEQLALLGEKFHIEPLKNLSGHKSEP